MNQNRPFYSTNTNLYDESFRSSAPTRLNGENVILSQEQQRRVCDIFNTSIVGNSFGLPGNQQIMCAQKQYFPGGVLFTFPQSHIAPQNQAQSTTQGGFCKCTPMCHANTTPIELSNFRQVTAPAAVNTFFPSSMEYQQLPREQFQLKFHHDRGTSCSDLLNHFTQVPASRGYPDLSNINGILAQTRVGHPKDCQTSPEVFFPSPPIEFSSNARKLVLCKNTPPPAGHVVDILDENATNEIDKKKVSFSESKNSAGDDKSSQITSDCICDEKKCKKKSKSNKKQQDSNDEATHDKPKKRQKEKEKKKAETPSNTSSETTVSSDPETHDTNDCEKRKKKRWWTHQDKTESGSSDTQSSENSKDDRSDAIKHKKRKSRRRKLKIDEKDGSGNGSQTDASNQTDSDADESCQCQ